MGDAEAVLVKLILSLQGPLPRPSLWGQEKMLTLAVLAAAAVFNVGVINPDTHLIESYLSCHVDYNTAVALITAEQSHYPDKALGIVDDDAKAVSDLEYGARACPQ
jgi:hypothetical protein